ncbi:hypothetical protein V8F20_000862, partial [Naviculisporaceae sp. PSN 640]
ISQGTQQTFSLSPRPKPPSRPSVPPLRCDVLAVMTYRIAVLRLLQGAQREICLLWSPYLANTATPSTYTMAHKSTVISIMKHINHRLIGSEGGNKYPLLVRNKAGRERRKGDRVGSQDAEKITKSLCVVGSQLTSPSFCNRYDYTEPSWMEAFHGISMPFISTCPTKHLERHGDRGKGKSKHNRRERLTTIKVEGKEIAMQPL